MMRRPEAGPSLSLVLLCGGHLGSFTGFRRRFHGDQPGEVPMTKLWANSGDSHLVEPDDVFSARMPADLAVRMPRSEKDPDGRHETVFVDGKQFRRRLP